MIAWQPSHSPGAASAQTLPPAVFDPEEFARSLAADQTIACCKRAIAATTDYLHGQFRAGVPASGLIRLRAQFIDLMLGALWDRQDWGGDELALVAVGGYGRGELHPHSDIDLLILLGEDCEDCRAQLEGFLTLLWDIGLDIGHSVRGVRECVRKAAQDITVLTNLMESRVIRGPQRLMDKVRELTGPEKMWPSPAFFQAKLEEQRARHKKFADTEYNLEPNVKSSPGGLRDLQVIGWIAERHFAVESLEKITAKEFLDADEMEVLLRGRDFMWQVRYALHMLTDREEDRLLFDHQRELAELWGFEDGDKLAVEQFMQAYYRWALALGQLNELLIQNFDQAILRQDMPDDIRVIDQRFQVRNGYIEARRADLFTTEPCALLEVFLLCATLEDIQGIAAPTIRLMRNSRHLVDDEFRADARNKRTFMAILRAPNKMSRQLRRMARCGILGAYLPEFGRIMGQMQHDLFHSYTVDAHTLEVVKNTRRFQYADFEERFPVASRVARRLRRVELLYIAALYHDIGKGRGGDHSELGAVDAGHFCREHGLDERDTELVVWLVRNHLVMSAVSQRKDISDPEVIHEFAGHVADQEHLDYLFALTVADINGTNPTLWNAWRGSLLRQLYTETRRALRRGLENPVDKQTWIEQSREAATNLLEYRGFTAEELEHLWRERSEDYFLRERAEDIAWHTEAIAGHHDRDNPLVLVRTVIDSSVANTTQIFIHARTHAHLFSRICTELEHLDLSVHDARIYSANDGMSLDTFSVLASDGQPIAEDATRLRHIREHLADALADARGSPQIVQRRTPRQVRSLAIPTETRMSVDEITRVSVLEVSSPDRPGLLARLGKIFVEFDIELQAAKIQTLGERVEDIFFITDEHQQPITDPARCAAIQQAIRRELDEPATA
ncbi:MAG: [protein-PII] uridylyltransferase [Halioglobus sp.]|nr:[protein-PII] uridylyltransferase [Halioglobus sp.]